MKHIIKTLLALLITVTAAMFYSPSVSAETITFPASGIIQNATGIKYVELNGYRFETPNSGTLLLKNGGLWDGNAYGTPTPVTITRVDGGDFALDSINATTSAAFACGMNWCGVDAVQVTGTYNGFTFGEAFKTSGYANSVDTFAPTDARWQRVKSVTFSTADSFVFNSIGLSAPTAPVSTERLINFAPAYTATSVVTANQFVPFTCQESFADGYTFTSSMRITSGCTATGVYVASALAGYSVGGPAALEIYAPAGKSFVLKSFVLTGVLKGYSITLTAYDIDGNLINDVLTLKPSVSGFYDLSTAKLVGVAHVTIRANTRNYLLLSNINIVE